MTKTQLSLYGLLVFVAVVAIDAATLVFDLGLKLTGCDTISRHVWEQWHWAMYPLVGLQLVAAAGLAVHLTFAMPRDARRL